MALIPRELDEYHVFLASPGDMKREREEVRRFFEQFNRQVARHLGVRFTVLDWENHATTGIGRPQDLITAQTLESYRSSLALVIGLMGQRFGSPTGDHDSGTGEEFEWALTSYLDTGFPEIKWFFRKVEQFSAPSDLSQIQTAVEQWQKVLAFKARFQQENVPNRPPLFYKEFTDLDAFREMLREDLTSWLHAPERPWSNKKASTKPADTAVDVPTQEYYENLVQDFQWLDISGIDTDRSFGLPLSDMYVRLRVMLDEELSVGDTEGAADGNSINIQTALERYRQLVIVGDPGSGKSTFLKYIALMIARSVLEDRDDLTRVNLHLEPPFPVPVFISCWDLSDFLSQHQNAQVQLINTFIVERFEAMGWPLRPEAWEQQLQDGTCCLLFDGLDEVPTEAGRALISRLFEKYVARYPENRYVITSRIRAYTGDTILRGQFTRCDIQAFNPDDRRAFLCNWFALLFQVGREQVMEPHSDSFKALNELSSSIEENDRIKTLALNPLLLTVISIVHWNRKRLPEQRVDLYDECIDVLLGQRKEAEHVQIGRRSRDVLDQDKEAEVQDNRAWMRKRFSEIAFQIMVLEEEEITRQHVLDRLIPRFMDRGAADEDRARSQAESFLDRQELRSGLLVSRRSHRYRFIHLTFQEYLAAWNLATQDQKRVLDMIKPHLRKQKWFETLQLLGGEWAKRSDENLDRYIDDLLGQQGKTIEQRAPIVALCANILNDTANVAEIQAATRRSYAQALQDTLQAFDRQSKVPPKTQLEILAALGKLGAAVKDHLISATKSAHNAVRSRALEMLIPHLSDEDLFGMTHILHDRSWKTIATYVSSLLDRNALQTMGLIENVEALPDKAVIAISRLLPQFENVFEPREKGSLICRIFARLGPDCLRSIPGVLVLLAELDAQTLSMMLQKLEHTAPQAVVAISLRQNVPKTETLIQLFGEAKEELAKGHFALLLAETGDKRAIDVLKPHLTNDSHHVRYLSALALDMLGFGDRKVLDDLLMVRVDAGEFTMGSKTVFGAGTQRKIKTGAFMIDRFPLNNAQYKRFIEAGGYQERSYWSDEGWTWKEERNVSEPGYIYNRRFNIPGAPVVGISWYEAEAYAKWAGKRLPTEDEWERAACGDEDAREYSWGDKFDTQQCNTSEGGVGQPSPVGSYPDGVSRHGCYDMIGNVLEWTSSLHTKDGNFRVVRGGSWLIPSVLRPLRLPRLVPP